MNLPIGIVAVFAVVASMQFCLAADPRYPDWPCAQAKVPEISLAAVWAGPPLGDGEDKWKADPKVSALVELHLRFHTYGMGWTDSAVRRYVRDAGDLLQELNELTRADCTTRNPARTAALSQRMDELEARITELGEQEELRALRPDLDGNQIMELLGIGPGRAVGQALDFLMELRLDEGPLGEEEATARLRAWWAAQQ